MIKFTISCLCLYLMIVVVIFLEQRKMQYFPNISPIKSPSAHGWPQIQQAKLQTSDGLNHIAWYLPPKTSDKPVLIYFHGNGGQMPDRVPKVNIYAQDGYGLMLVEYRGYGGQEGEISEQGLYKDAKAAMTWLLEKHTEDQIIIYGESIGTGVAVETATHYPKAKALVLEAGFSSAADVAADIYFYIPVHYLMKDQYKSAEKIGQLEMPIYMIHGDQDRVIPLHFGQKLHQAAKPHAILDVIVGAGHNDLYEYGGGDKVRAFIKTLLPAIDTEKPPLSE